MIYGNLFVYSEEAMRCKDLNFNSRKLWLLMLVNIIFGYIIMTLYGLVMVVGGLGSLLAYCFCRRKLKVFYSEYIADSAFAEKIPYIELLKGVGVK